MTLTDTLLTMTLAVAGTALIKDKIICPQCHKLNQKSIVQLTGAQTTLAMSHSYYDEDGNFVQGKDPNVTTNTFRCSKGHTFAIESRTP